MTNEYHGPDAGSGHGGPGEHGGDGWEPVPRSEYDSDATAFVQLPPDGFPDAPLAAPGHGYVPPQITVSPASGAAATDPAATGVWVLPAELTGAAGTGSDAGAGDGGADASHEVRSHEARSHEVRSHEVSWPEPNQGAESSPYAAGQGATGQWSIPLADGELPDESGEFTSSALAAQWGERTPPATLPGGAPAPWATQPWAAEAQPVAEPELPVEPERAVEPERPVVEPELPVEPEAPVEPEPVLEPEPALEPEPVIEAAEVAEPEAAPEAEPVPEPVLEEASVSAPEADQEPQPTPSAGPAPSAEPEPGEEPPAPLPLHDDHPLVSYVLRVNGTDRPVTDAWIGESLLYVLRERLGLAGAKDGCSQGECGACNVQVDGRLVASCLVPAATAAGSEVRTVEGLATDGQPSDVQRALAACGAVQCGFCVPGMAMTVHDLLEGNPAPTELETRQALCGNLCRCSGYRGVLDAVRKVSDERKASTETAAAAAAGAASDEPRIPHQAGPARAEGLQDTSPPHDPQNFQDDPQNFQDGGQA